MESGKKKNDYNFRVSHQILSTLAIEGISSTQAYLFFAEQIESMQNVDPNFGPKRYVNKRRQTIPLPCWIMRGYYPGTNAFFKITMIHKENGFDYSDAPYYAKITMPVTKTAHKFEWIRGAQMKPFLLEHKADQMLLGADEPLKQYEHAPELKKPRCMSPKGVPVFKLEKKGKKCVSSKSRSKKRSS